ncbi:MAG: patatin-like phospholipase family protein [Hyphomicrobiaceae bacterium]|nr:patatin-like phospholipase family protein [Hyphomicrobiaceae bacterium]
MVRLFKRDLRFNLALQGGGAHGAFTWGVLDRLLDEQGISFGWISATSAGAVNAAALAAGLAEGGRAGAQAKLRQIWTAVYKAGVPDFLRMNPFLYSLTRSSALSQMTSLMSPYEFNPMGYDPLRRLLSNTIDFELIRSKAPVELLIAATDVATGQARFFRRAELTVESVLASACLPTLHHAVEIDGRAYWDGGFSANPDLITLARESPVADTVLVQITPSFQRELPTGVREITGQINRLTFNAPLRRDVELIAAIRREAGGAWGAGRFAKRLARHRFHLIDAGRHTSMLSAESKLKADWGLFTYLHGAGRMETHKWLDRHRKDIGRRETVDLAQRLARARESDGDPQHLGAVTDSGAGGGVPALMDATGRSGGTNVAAPSAAAFARSSR